MGFYGRYPRAANVDGLPSGEGAFLACSFWYVQAIAMQGRKDDARRYFEKLLKLANDVGLLPEEYDPKLQRFVGNFPQAFSHVGLINAALAPISGRAVRRHHRWLITAAPRIRSAETHPAREPESS